MSHAHDPLLNAAAAAYDAQSAAARSGLGSQSRSAGGHDDAPAAAVGLHHLFERQALRRPDAVALVHDGRRMRYAELNARANRLAQRLIDAGAGPDDPVALCAQRGFALPVAALAALKAGAAYLPFDPAHASARLASMLADAAPRFALCDDAGRVALGEPALARLRRFDPLADSACDDERAWAARNPRVAALRPHHLAYVIYTSGSTGAPKGVMVEHRNLLHLAATEPARSGIDERSRVAQFASPGFDASVLELVMALANGAELHLATPAQRASAEAFNEWFERERLTHALLPPAFLQGRALRFARRPVLLLGGEAPSPALVRELAAQATVINAYGPTEITVCATQWIAPQDAAGELAQVPIGRALAGTRVYLLDAERRPVARGETGEIFIGGDGVARGYLGRPDLTAERFLADPFAAEPGARMYRTGDLARELDDGSLLFLGRNDHQVKLRGYRIELGEIQARLGEHPRVRECAVLAREDAPGETQLVAYYAGDAEPGALRAFLAERLPGYMLPSAFVALEALPLTGNGKLDRAALPAPGEADRARADYLPPQGEDEIALARLWGELLGLERIGRDDDFFALGGHSLTAARLRVRLRERLGVELPMAALFDHPRLSACAALLAGLRAQAQALPPVEPPIEPAPREGALAVSHAQRRLWFLHQLEPGEVRYNMPLRLDLDGELDLAALRRSLDDLFARHEALRTVFVCADGEAQARLLPARQGLALAEHDLRGAADAATRLRELCEFDARTPFDLATGPLIRARLIRTGERAHTLMLVQHHIVCDGWSLHLLSRELGALYAAHRAGEPDPLPPLHVQYPDYAAWEQRWLRGERLKPQADYWRDALAGAPALLALPTDRPRPPRPAQAAGTLPLRIDAERVARLQRLCRAHGCSLFTAVAAAWSVVLARLSGQDEVVIGTPSANRERAEIEPLLGFFVNTLALRVDLSDEPDAARLLQRVRAAALGAQANQDLPFEQVVEIVQPERRVDRTPLFQALLAWQSNETGRFDLPGLQVRASQPFAAVRFELELHVREQDGELVGELGYASELFEPATIERQLRYLHAALDALCGQPLQAATRIDLIGADERAQLLEELGRGEPGAQAPLECVHRSFERQARATPRATALIHGERRMDYAELDARAERLARRLRALGAGPDQRIGLCAQRGFGVVVGALAALKAGAAYVPLDLSHPRERLAQVLADAAPAAVLADADGREALSAALAGGMPALDLDAALATSLDADDAAEEAPAPHAEPSPEHLAYVIYTSGSTGTPKGVAMPHAPLAQLLRWQRGALAPARRVLQYAALGFDVAFQEIFGALCSGAALVLVDAQQRLDLAALPALLRAHRIDRLHLPYIAAQGLAEAAEDGGEAALEALRAHLREIIVAGEQLRLTPQLRRLLRQLPQCRLHNHYGPTETHVAVACMLGPDLDAEPDHAPIGRPVSGSRVYLLDRHGQPVPRGAAGELYLAGACVARGYLHRRELEAERFLADPFAGGAARMYRTGDLARFRADGRLEFLGRNDQQVKIRGFRIEPGEIEARLAEHPRVRECAVLARERPDGQLALIAYAVPANEDRGDGAGQRDDSNPDDGDWAAALRAHLAARLPDYMLPAAFVAVRALPVTPNGKLDARALPAPDPAAFAHAEFEAPRGASETALAQLWQELLGVARVGRGDHFFELGGHSLIAVRLLSRIARGFAVELPLAELFARPRLADLAAAIDALAARTARAGDGAPAFEPVAPRGPGDADDSALPLSLAQQRLWFLSQFYSVSANYHIPLALRLRGALDVAALRRALDRIFARHEGLRSIFVEQGGVARARLLDPDSGIDWLQRDLRGADAEARLRAQMDRDVDAAFDLAQGPLLRARLSRVGEDEHVLLLVVHHIVADGWSLGVLARELGALYAAFAAGRADPLPPLAVHYPDYALWQRRQFDPERLRAQSDYWRETLAGAPALLELPLDRPRPPQQSFAAGFVPLRLDAALSAALKRVGQRHGATLFMTLLAAWSAVLARVSGQEDVVIGAATAGRNRHEIEPLIGFFVNTLALRIDLSGAPDPAALLARARKATLDAQANQDLPFEQVVDALQLPRRLDRTPLFQAMFAWQSGEDGLPRLPGLDVSAEPLRLHWTKFDLELVLGERDGAIEGGLNYASALFDRDTIERHRDYLLAALAALAAETPAPVAQWPLLTARERDALLHERNRTEVGFDREGLLDQAFARQARRRPQADAVVHGQARLSYAELDARANRLAHRLIEHGVARGDRVALGARRGFGLIVGALAILKAGAVYLPFDPGYSSARLARILADAAPALALCDAAGRAALDAGARAIGNERGESERNAGGHDASGRDGAAPALPRLDLDDAALWSQGPAHPPEVPGRSSRDLAYLIYTSGSTGAPKGVMVEHRNALHLAAAQARRFRLGRRSRVLQFASIGFDASVFDLLMAFVRGGALYLPSDAERETAPALLDFIRRRRITHATLPPALLQGHAIPPFEHRPTLLLGGEAPSPALVRALSERARVVNAYGPTEITVCASAWTAPRGHARDAADAPVPIGRPLANVRLYLLDAQRQPVPTGAVGELYIGGAGVARGYFGRPDLTAERFLDDPFDPRPGARMYRSGDLARYLPDGELLFLGRNDEQIKLRGFRIEPAEIQAHLGEHPAVRECAVVAREDRAGEPYLVAYVVAAADSAARADDDADDEALAAALRAHLGERLPDYMRPAAFVRIDALPLTAHGKLDRRALPAPAGSHFARAAYQPPRPGEESRLAALWRELLDVPRVGRHDDFFELGGHSLRAVQLAARLREEFGAQVPVRELFAHPRLDDMAALLRAGADAPGEGRRSVDLDAEAALDPSLDGAGLAAAAAPSHYRELLLTGATGFLGAFLLQALSQRTGARVHCLVRCDGEADGRRRLDAALAALDLPASDPARVAIVPGDLAEPRLGLSASEFAALAERIDAIYHNGAWVNSLHGYAALKPANVGGTLEVMRLAASARRKHVHYVSTLSTLPTPAQARALGAPAGDEEALARCWRALGSGYARSKWVAERLLRAGGERGLPFTVYRPTHIAGAGAGACNASDAWSLFVQACYRLGSAPDIDLRMNSLAVDRMAAAIVELSLRGDCAGRSLNLADPHGYRLADWIDCVLEQPGMAAAKRPYAQWLRDCAADPATAAVASILPAELAPQAGEDDGDGGGVAIGNAVAELLDARAFAPLDREHLRRCARWLYRHRR